MKMVRARDLDGILKLDILIEVTLVEDDRKMTRKRASLEFVATRKRHLLVVVGPIIDVFVRSLSRTRKLLFLLGNLPITKVEDGPSSSAGHVYIRRNRIGQVVRERRKQSLFVPYRLSPHNRPIGIAKKPGRLASSCKFRNISHMTHSVLSRGHKTCLAEGFSIERYG
jgi:hypothetical protein